MSLYKSSDLFTENGTFGLSDVVQSVHLELLEIG